MPRRNVPARRRGGSPDRGAAAAGSGAGWLGEHTEDWRGLDYRVRPVSGSSSSGPYRCPGCDQLLPAGRPHVVVWPSDDPDAEDRRHWHTACWGARGRRAPGIQRSRNAPRYG